MANILSGLEGLGLGKLENAQLYSQNAEDELNMTAQDAPKEAKKPSIEDYVFMKSHTCPVCEAQIKNATVKSGRARLVGTDRDLRTKYEPVDPHKYDVIVCQSCGYAALTRYFDKITLPQAKLVKEEISGTFKGIEQLMNPSYDQALTRYRLALGNAIVKKAKSSEKAYICMKMAWIVRAKREDMNPNTPDYDQLMEELRDDELELLTNALNGYITARQSESYPIAGMDEITLDYLMAAIAVEVGKNDIAAKLIPNILTSRTASSRIKDRARELKEVIVGKN